MKKNLKTATLCIHSGHEPKNGEPRQLPIIQSTTFKYDNTEEMALLFDLKKEGYFYTRLQNPTNDAVARKIAALEGGVGAMLTSSGQAANFYAVFNICQAGDHFVTSNEIYGGTYNLFGVTMKKLGIECTFVNQEASEEEIQKAFRPNTKLLFGETISNPGCKVLDIEKFAKIAHKNGVPLSSPALLKSFLAASLSFTSNLIIPRLKYASANKGRSSIATSRSFIANLKLFVYAYAKARL